MTHPSSFFDTTLGLTLVASMSTRSTSASTRRAAQELVKLLFAPRLSRKGPLAHGKLDPQTYSYRQLKTAYLQRMKALHPDKFYSQFDGNHTATEVTTRKEQLLELKTAWDKYETASRNVRKVGNPERANFTMFAVGCSFDDSPEEKAWRTEITDQACRGWFSAGALAENSTIETETAVGTSPPTQTSLCDDGMFIEDKGDKRPIPSSPNRVRRSLVDLSATRWRD